MVVVQETSLVGTSDRSGRGNARPSELARPSLGFVPSRSVCDPRDVGLANKALELTGASLAAGIGAARRRDCRGAGSSTLTR